MVPDMICIHDLKLRITGCFTSWMTEQLGKLSPEFASKKQLQYVMDLIKPWAGIVRDGSHKPVVWSRPEEIVEEMSWRGLDPWGDERDWGEVPYPEAKGLARLALQKSPNDLVNYICNAFKLKRRHEKTLEQFQSWVDEV